MIKMSNSYVRQSVVSSPNKSIAKRSLQLGILQTTINNFLRKRLRMQKCIHKKSKLNMRKHRSKPVASAADILVNIDDDLRR